MNQATHYRQVQAQVREKILACGRDPENVAIIAVSKSFPVSSLLAAYDEGCRIFGESKVQEALKKIPLLPSDCQWHFIGTLQSNKISKAISSFSLIHSVDHPILALKISQESQSRGMMTRILLQVNTSGELTKHGLNENEWEQALDSVNQLSHIRIEGLMTMAPFTQDDVVIRSCFRKLYQLREKWKWQMRDPAAFVHLSMGMSNDFLIAIEEGATLLRIGSLIFGVRKGD